MRTALLNHRPLWHRLLHLALLLGAAALVVGCDDRSHRAPLTAPAPMRPSLLVNAPIDSDWDTYTTDVAVRITGTYPGFKPKSADRAFGYQLTRTLGSDGVWNETITFRPAARRVATSGAGDYEPDLGRIETNDRQSVYRLYDARGRLIVPSAPDTTAPRGNGQSVPAAPLPGAFPRHPASPPRTAAQLPTLLTAHAATPSADSAPPEPTDPRAWVDQFIVGAKARERIRASLERQVGAPQGRIRGLERFVLKRENTTIEILFDPVIGAVAETNVAIDGKLVSHAVNTYAPLRGGWCGVGRETHRAR